MEAKRGEKKKLLIHIKLCGPTRAMDSSPRVPAEPSSLGSGCLSRVCSVLNKQTQDLLT